jgi:hypothetical protein
LLLTLVVLGGHQPTSVNGGQYLATATKQPTYLTGRERLGAAPLAVVDADRGVVGETPLATVETSTRLG